MPTAAAASARCGSTPTPATRSGSSSCARASPSASSTSPVRSAPAAETAVEPEEPPEHVLARLAALVDEAVEAAGVDDDKILGAGIGAPGPLDLRSGTLLNILHPRSWTNLPLAEAVAAALKLRVIMDNDATAAALGEHWRGVGEGAERLHLPLPGHRHRRRARARRPGLPRPPRQHRRDQPHPGGSRTARPCECGSHGCLALYTNPDGLLREAAKVVLEAPPTDPVAKPPKTLERLVAHRDPRIQRVVERAGAHLAKVVVECSRVLDPELIVLGGPLLPTLGGPFGHAIEQALEAIDEPGAPPPRVHALHQRIRRGRHRRGDPRLARPLRADGTQAEPGQPAAARTGRPGSVSQSAPRGRTHAGVKQGYPRSGRRRGCGSGTRTRGHGVRGRRIGLEQRRGQGSDDRVLGLEPGGHDRPGQAGHQRGDRALQEGERRDREVQGHPVGRPVEQHHHRDHVAARAPTSSTSATRGPPRCRRPAPSCRSTTTR